MEFLRVTPPTHYEGAVEAIPDVITAIESLATSNAVYEVESDKYFEVHKDAKFGTESHLTEAQMMKIFAERGGDPERVGKRDPLDALLWLAKRPGEPSWDSPFGAGRPGWHIECAAIALKFAESTENYVIDIQGGGQDLIFPHHEMSTSQVRILTGKDFARAYVHAALIGLDGEKMSKSRGNLVFVSELIKQGIDPMTIRWALLKRPYRSEYMWQRTETTQAELELTALKNKLKGEIPPTSELISKIYDYLANDLNSAAAITAINDWVLHDGSGGNGEELTRVIDGLLGISLSA